MSDLARDVLVGVVVFGGVPIAAGVTLAWLIEWLDRRSARRDRECLKGSSLVDYTKDDKGWVIAAYQSCHSGVYEGSVGLYCRHLEVVHHCPPGLLDALRNGSSQGHWCAVDDLHRVFTVATPVSGADR